MIRRNAGYDPDGLPWWGLADLLLVLLLTLLLMGGFYLLAGGGRPLQLAASARQAAVQQLLEKEFAGALQQKNMLLSADKTSTLLAFRSQLLFDQQSSQLHDQGKALLVRLVKVLNFLNETPGMIAQLRIESAGNAQLPSSGQDPLPLARARQIAKWIDARTRLAAPLTAAMRPADRPAAPGYELAIVFLRGPSP